MKANDALTSQNRFSGAVLCACIFVRRMLIDVVGVLVVPFQALIIVILPIDGRGADGVHPIPRSGPTRIGRAETADVVLVGRGSNADHAVVSWVGPHLVASGYFVYLTLTLGCRTAGQ